MTPPKTTLACLLFGPTALYPVASLLAACLRYRFKLTSITAFAIVVALLSAGVVIFDLACKDALESKTAQVLHE